MKVAGNVFDADFFRKLDAMRVRNFRCKLPIRLECGDFLIKTAENWDELCLIFQQRRRVFFNTGFINETYCLEDIDLTGDYIAIFDMRNGQVMASLVVFSSSLGTVLPCEKKWKIQKLQAEFPGILETDWLCIDPSSGRSRLWLRMLIKGFLHYIRTSGDSFLIGECSMPCSDPFLISQVCGYMERHGFLSRKYDIHPRQARMLSAPMSRPYLGNQEIKCCIPPLFFWYFNLGMKAVPVPRFVACGGARTDFLLLGDDEMLQALSRRG